MTPLKYWSWDEVREFMVAHDLVIADGMGQHDEVAITPKGFELLRVLATLTELPEGKS